MTNADNMTTTKNAALHATQRAYMIASAAYDVALSAHVAATTGLDWSDFDAANEIAESSRTAHNIDALSAARLNAETAMLDWSLEASLKCAAAKDPAKRAMAIEVSTKGRRHPAIRAKLIDLALRLDARASAASAR